MVKEANLSKRVLVEGHDWDYKMNGADWK